MHSDRSGYWANGQVSEFCGELIDTNHTTILGLADRFEPACRGPAAAEPAGSTETYWFLGGRYSAAQADIDFGPVRDARRTTSPRPGIRRLEQIQARRLRARPDERVRLDQTRVPGGHWSPFGRLLDGGL